MDHTSSQSDSPGTDAPPRKGRKKKSMVWEHFTIETAGNDRARATCNHCKKSFAYISGSKQAGTSHLKRHIALGICPEGQKIQKRNQLALCSTVPKANIALDGNLTRKRCQASSQRPVLYFNEDVCCQNLAKMIIQQDYPLHMVEQPGFIDFVQTLNPNFRLPSVDWVQEKIMDIYLKEKLKLWGALNSMPAHLSLTVDVWRSVQGSTSAVIAGHFVDQSWKLQRRIFNVISLECPNSYAPLSEAVSSCLSDWKLQDKLLAVSIDRCCTNENAIEGVRSLLSIKNSLILNGKLLIKDCYACVLRSLAVDTLEYIRGTVEKIRYSVSYFKSSQYNEEMFIKLKQKLQVPSLKNLVIDDVRRWDTTYLMLSSACELKEVFSCMDAYDDAEYKSTISMEEWEQVQSACEFLKLFYDAANKFTSPKYPTANMFFHDVFGIHYELMNAALGPDPFVCSLTSPLHERFSKYWENCFEVLAVAVAMDPRFKMLLVEFSFSRMYGEVSTSYVNLVKDGLHELFLEYVVQALPPLTFVQKESDPLVKTEVPEIGILPTSENDDFDIYISDYTVEQQVKTEVDQYLEESLLPRSHDFDTLGWWKFNSYRYPTLSKLAVDILSIPISTLSGDSVFDTRHREIGVHRSTVSNAMLQTLICAKDWLQHDSSSDVIV